MKLVVDTNVLLSGSLWTGTASRLVDGILDGLATLCLSADVLAEFGEVIQRKKFRARFESRGITADELLSRFREVTMIVEPTSIAVPILLRDPDDVHVLACALSCEAHAIVSGDKDLLVLGAFNGIPIITITDALALLGLPVE